MLVLSRKPGERIYIGDDIVIELVDSKHDKARFGVTAPKGVEIHREEVYRERQREKAAADAEALALTGKAKARAS